MVRKNIKKLKDKFTSKVWFFLYLIIKKIGNVLAILGKICEFISKIIKIILTFLFKVVLSKIVYLTFSIVTYCFFKIKFHLYDNIFCPVLNFAWVNFGGRYFFYNYADHYFLNPWIDAIWNRMPLHLYYLVTDKYYYKIITALWFFKRDFKRFIKKNVFYVSKLQVFYVNKRKDILKACLYFALCIFLIVFFINFFFVRIFNIQFFFILRRMINFILSSIRYFVLYLKFKWYFFFFKSH